MSILRLRFPVSRSHQPPALYRWIPAGAAHSGRSAGMSATTTEAPTTDIRKPTTSMPRIVARPNQLDLDSAGRRDYWLALEHDSIWGDHLIPLTVWVGPDARPGQGLVSFGSN